MDKNKSLYFIAIIPSGTIYNQIVDWKKYFAEKHASKAALKSPPHITLHMPFRFPESKEHKIEASLRDLVENHKPFSIYLKDFGAFEPRVIFVNVKENNQLRELQRDMAKVARQNLGLLNHDYKNRGFTPHITIAFRDLKKPEFLTAWKKLRTEIFSEEFVAKEVCLLKHNNTCWEIYRQFKLKI